MITKFIHLSVLDEGFEDLHECIFLTKLGLFHAYPFGR
jgi:hypothetical protein